MPLSALAGHQYGTYCAYLLSVGSRYAESLVSFAARIQDEGFPLLTARIADGVLRFAEAKKPSIKTTELPVLNLVLRTRL